MRVRVTLTLALANSLIAILLSNYVHFYISAYQVVFHLLNGGWGVTTCDTLHYNTYSNQIYLDSKFANDS